MVPRIIDTYGSMLIIPAKNTLDIKFNVIFIYYILLSFTTLSI